MFDLDREVTAWSRAVHAARCHSAASVAELTDHLYCEIERRRATGLSDEEAFRTAITRLGPASELTAEHDKNRSPLAVACQVAAKLDPVTRPGHRWIMLAHALVWGTLILASSVVLTKAGDPAIPGSLLCMVFVPLWWVSEQILRRALRQKPAGRA